MAAFPASGHFLQSVREKTWQTIDPGISIDKEAIRRLLVSPAFTTTFHRLSSVPIVSLPLNFASLAAEVNVISILSLLNFGSGYRIPLRDATGRGAWDNIRYLVLALYLGSPDGQGDPLSAKALKEIDVAQVASLLNVNIHVEKAHPSLHGVTVGEMGGPLYEIVQLITTTLNETGDVLIQQGYPDLGSFVLETFNHARGSVELLLERLVRAIPGLRDMDVVDGKGTIVLPFLRYAPRLNFHSEIYIFKKALFLIRSVSKRFASTSPAPFPIPDTENIPIMSDNVIPSMLVHLGVLDLAHAKFGALHSLFAPTNAAQLLSAPLADGTLAVSPSPSLSAAEAYILRAAAITACDEIVAVAREMELAEELKWIRTVSVPQTDMWLWGVAKDRPDYRSLPRFAQIGTAFY
ncbi:hypothetical protein SISSUDRAFT_1014162 [Sistotremastrum suecicum HHB10207 ss-3]|uniref:Queuosine 5'-phosphate N-glycosylase/hydrolase n=1 Tax=Sistotremastrum suecicum HHB10207 ss-3 TaxID=1314776 RepID=A0A166IEP8_9AGAM|nr:hypothetical protein SISSUDRAFT_1014162 [Sistotremastrum suecicum HHB10207 ss-3]